MPIASVRRRLIRLEESGVFTPPRRYPPLTGPEIQAMALRIVEDDWLAPVEVRRLEQHSPVIDREILITAYNGNVFMKRYPGVDLSEV